MFDDENMQEHFETYFTKDILLEGEVSNFKTSNLSPRFMKSLSFKDGEIS